jgi:L-ascorbate metabolism protein UlaG (beta-lactamase superfamily)
VNARFLDKPPFSLRRSACVGGLVLVFSLLTSVPVRSATVEITYLANEGVMIDCGGQRILIDALLRDSLDTYVRHPPDVQEKIETGKPPFDHVVLALATHFHLDHWDPGAIARFLANNPHAMFASTPQATAMLPWSFRQRVRSLWPGGKNHARLAVGGANVQAFPLEHGKAQNLGYRISVCGKTLLHLGDADPSEASFRTLIAAGPADVALVPFWWLLDEKGAEFVRHKWRPQHLIAVHFGTTDMGWAKKVQATWRNAWVCTKQGESRKF